MILLRGRHGAGVVPAVARMVATPAIRNLIREEKMHQARGTMEASRRDGMVTMDQSLLDLIQRNLIDAETARPLAVDPSKFA